MNIASPSGIAAVIDRNPEIMAAFAAIQTAIDSSGHGSISHRALIDVQRLILDHLDLNFGINSIPTDTEFTGAQRRLLLLYLLNSTPV